ncbi:DUF3089 domain-containing protein [Novosphingobium sp. SL115]|uniref:DUF3089 domain-containing protein n=1 Tax=Novosphingobium sp. SL115 TaxID=2995150 RepID=UPI0022723732|nr:DUF3089 domain-containing protein [Novosphingobium sp. SL115]MCY1672910.1 DUF3089 domain-containing protein [Novosphingobium sp. SL115]
MAKGKVFSVLAAVLCGMLPAGVALAQPAEIAAMAPPAPDYADAANWAAGPAGPGAAAALPAGASAAAVNSPADVFYLHPTTDRSPTLWNQDTRDAASNRWVDESTIARQASVFSACCAIYAPRYRAATYKALGSAAHRDAAYALAYTDVERAFDWFLKNVSKGRPFIIAGHSQGAKHVGDLLEKRVEGTPLRKRMVAAYIIGINIAEGEFGRRFKQTGPCNTPAQTGCVLQWNALAAGANLPMVAGAFEKSFTDVYGQVPGQQMLCINPVTFDARRPAATTDEAKGAVPGDPGTGPMLPLRAKAVAVQCQRGMAMTYAMPGLDLKELPGGSLHYEDVALFYEDIRANAVVRVKAWGRGRR